MNALKVEENKTSNIRKAFFKRQKTSKHTKIQKHKQDYPNKIKPTDSDNKYKHQQKANILHLSSEI